MKNCLLFFGLAFICCKKENAVPVSLTEKTIMNVSYESDARQKMDVYLPANRSTSKTKVLVLIHGGGWNTGDKSDFTPYVDTLKKRLQDYAIININYRLATGTTNFFPTQENDIKTAIEFIFSKKNEYNISEKFILLGASAGAHLSLLQAYKNTAPVKIKAVVDFFGPIDLTDMYNNPASPLVPPAALAAIIGATPITNPTLYEHSSPVNFITAQSPPTIILQGGADPLVAPSQSLKLKNQLENVGVTNQYIYYPSESHGWIGANLVDSFNKIAAFLTANID